jgi:hypothetical protein
MKTHQQVVALAKQAHRQHWSVGADVSKQTKKSLQTCKEWQQAVLAEFGDRFIREHPLNESGPCQKIDLLDTHARVAYEMKVSKNNVHMEIYRDVFKSLVFNERNPKNVIKRLVFLAPAAGLK